MGSVQPKSDAYVLNRNHAAASRLNYQHYLWKETVGFTLHPDIPKPKADAKIADVATGTGIWMIDVARDLPESVQFDGSDIDISQCPPQDFLPPNIKAFEWDLFGEVPEELVGKYDLVHLALIGVVIKDDNAVPVIKNLCKLLKPGGWLQWQEMDDDGSSVVKANPSVKSDAMEKLRQYMHSPKEGVKGNHTWRRELPATLKANGFAEVQLHRYETAPAFTRFWNDNYMTVVEEFTSKALKDPARREEAFSLLNAAIEEAHNGACIVIPQLVAVAQKAS